MDRANELFTRLKSAGIRVKVDDSDNSPGWKFAEHEMRGIPVRIELGPKDIEAGKCIAVRRVDREKIDVPLGELESRIPEILDEIHRIMSDKVRRTLVENTHTAGTFEQLREITAGRGGFVKTMWCGDESCELRVKDELGVSSRCIPLEQEHISDKCPICGGEAKHMIVWGVAY